MSGLLSTLSEIGEISSRNLLTGMVQWAEPYLAAIVGLVSAPEFQAGLQNWGAAIGGFTTAGLESAVGEIDRIATAVQPLLDAQAPAWLVALQGLATAGDYQLGIKIAPEVTTIKTPDDGLTVDVTATATKVTTKEGGEYSVEVVGNVVSIDTNTLDDKPPIEIPLTGKWKSPVQLGMAMGADLRSTISNQLLLAAAWDASVSGQMADNLEANMRRLKIAGDWAEGALSGLWASLDGNFKGPVTIFGSWGSTTLSDLWSDIQDWLAARPVTVEVKTSYTAGNTPKGVESGTVFPIDVNAPYPEYQGDPRYFSNPASPYGYYYDQYGHGHNAAGTDSWRGGWTWVGEEGPELINLPRGTEILSNRDSSRMVERFAEGAISISETAYLADLSRQPSGTGVANPPDGGDSAPRIIFDLLEPPRPVPYTNLTLPTICSV